MTRPHLLALLLLLAGAVAAAPAPAPAPARPAAPSPRPAPAPAAPPPPQPSNASSPWPPTYPAPSVDTAAIAAVEPILGLGPLSDAERRQLYGEGLPYLPATLGTQLEAYDRIRRVVAGGPESVVRAPLAVVYVPPAFRGVEAGSPPAARLGVTSVVDGGGSGSTDVDSIAPDDVADDSANYVGDDAAVPPRLLLPLLPRVLTWACGSKCAGAPGRGAGGAPPAPTARWRVPTPKPAPSRPASNETLAYMSALELGALVRARKVTAVELVEVFTARLKSLDPYLEAVATFTTASALAAARSLDADAAAGRWRGPLHGVPYGVKDVIAVAGAPTTWGVKASVRRSFDEDATVVARLAAAGAVCVAKLATGELAFDDVWWGGHTKNPWNIAQGASGSSAGPAAAVAAGGVPFALGTETQGSLVSPAARCGATAVRPTPGLVPRTGVMQLADSLDKVGPICRYAADCAAVLDAVRGADGVDPAARDALLTDPASIDLASLTVAVLPSARAMVEPVVAALRARGVRVIDRDLTYATPATDVATTILLAEGASSFDYWIRSGTARSAARQDFWPPLFRLARLVPAPDYVAAQRARSVLAAEVAAAFEGVEAGKKPSSSSPPPVRVDAFLGNGTDLLAAANLVGLASVAAPLAHAPARGAPPGSPRRSLSSVGFFAPPHADGVVLALASAWQAASDVHTRRPPVGAVEAGARDAACDSRSRCRLSEEGRRELGLEAGRVVPGGGAPPAR